MLAKFIEVCNENGGMKFNWGKFMVGRFTLEEWRRQSLVDEIGGSLLSRTGWSGDHVLVFDLQTGEGAMFLPGGSVKADLDKHRVWVCPMFEPFLGWLYKQDLGDLNALPDEVTLTFEEAPPEMAGYRRPGPKEGSD